MEQEEEALKGWTDGHEARLMNAYNYILEREDWDKYSNCQEGYLNVRNENELNGFISDFKDKCDSTFISNFKLVEKDFKEEMKIFDESQLHYHNLERLRIQGKATLNRDLEEYAFKYLKILYDIEVDKIEALTKYFVENFHMLKQKLRDERGKDEDENTWEWYNSEETNKYGFFANNNTQGGYRSTSTKFEKMNFMVKEVNKIFVTQSSLLRFYWSKYDIREYYSMEEFSPYINIGGSCYLDAVVYPDAPVQKGTWLTRNAVGENYKGGSGASKGSQTVKQRYSITLSKDIFTKDLKDVKEVKVGIYSNDDHEWKIDDKDFDLKSNLFRNYCSFFHK